LGYAKGEAFIWIGVSLGFGLCSGEERGGEDAGVVVGGNFYGHIVDICVAGAAEGGAVGWCV
jgi:hypothetical protein